MDRGSEERNMDTDWGRDGGLITATHSTHTTRSTQHHDRQKMPDKQKWLGLSVFVIFLAQKSSSVAAGLL